MTGQRAGAGRLALAAVLLAAAAWAAALIWWSGPPPGRAASPSAAPPVPVVLEPALVPVVAPAPGEADAGTTMPQVRIPPGSAGQDALAAALAAARSMPPPAAAPAIAQANSFEEAIAAVRAARGEAPPAAAVVSPFGAR